MSAEAIAKDERTLLKITLKNQADSETYDVSLLNAEGNREFRTTLEAEKAAYFQLCLFQDKNPKRARQIHIAKGNLVGTMQGRFSFDEETLRQDATVLLQPRAELDEHGEEIPGKG